LAKYRKYITRGILEPIHKVPFHSKAPIKRTLMLGKNQPTPSKIHLAIHQVNARGKKIAPYTELHRHNVDEIDLIISETGKLVYEIQLGDEFYKIHSPCTIYIPKGLPHKANVLSGKGTFVCIIMAKKYKTF
jgi:mannose-6-phosphate isomerase-like protein (cupin superfamily)